MKALLILCLAVFSLQAFAVVETYEFGSDDKRERYHGLIDELRCPKCQNQNLDGSNSPIAKDLRRELHRMIEDGQDDESIKAFMVKRYGNFVLYKPPVDKNTIVLWGLPGILGFFAVIFVILLRRRQQVEQGALNDVERQRLTDILKKYS